MEKNEEAAMRNFIIGLSFLALLGVAAPASADCIYDMRMAWKVIELMPDGPNKKMAERELKMAVEAALAGDEKMCLIHVGVCAQYAKR
jgi:hypothetical protein